MAKETIEALIEGGKATAAPPLGPALGPLGVNIGQIVGAINEKTKDFKGMQVPVKVTVDSETKEFDISIGTPPASALIKKEAGIKKASGNPKVDLVADLKIEQILKIAKMKEDALLGNTVKDKVKEIIGTCRSMGIMVEGKPAQETIDDVNNGNYDQKISSGKTELTAEELKAQEEEKKQLAEEIEQRRSEYEAQADEVLKTLNGKDRAKIKAKMIEIGIPAEIMNEKLPVEEKDKK